MLTDVAIWNPPSPRVRYGAPATVALQSKGSEHKAERDFTDADYVPVDAYLKAGGSLMRIARAPVEIVATASEPTRETLTGTSRRERAAIGLYTAIFNYRSPPPPALSIIA